MILVQREFAVPHAQRAAFEERSRSRVWPAFLHFGAPMVVYGSWAFGGRADVMVTHTVYEDFTHWEATRWPDGAYFRDRGVVDEIEPFLDGVLEDANAMLSAEARPYELIAGMSPAAFRREAGGPLATVPPTFGRGGIISERTMVLREDARDEFVRLSADVIWPWLESEGGRRLAIGANLMGDSHEITTWFSFPSVAAWHRFTRPQTAGAPPEAQEAYRQRHHLVRQQRGRLLRIETDWGADGALRNEGIAERTAAEPSETRGAGAL